MGGKNQQDNWADMIQLVKQLDLPNVSLFDGVHGKSKVYQITDIIEMIRSGKTDYTNLSKQIGSLQRFDIKSDRYRRAKNKLPAVTFGGVFGESSHGIDHLQSVSGLLVLDFDNIDVPHFIMEAEQIPETYIAFVSPSNNGVKIVVRLDPIPTASDFDHCFYAAEELYSEFGAVDSSGRNINRLCFLNYDEHCYWNQNSKKLEWQNFDFESKIDTERKQHRTPLKIPINSQGNKRLPKLESKEEFLQFAEQELGINVIGESWTATGHAACITIDCPWVPEHEKDAFLVFVNTGAKAINCHHNSCKQAGRGSNGYGFQELYMRAGFISNNSVWLEQGKCGHTIKKMRKGSLIFSICEICGTETFD